MKTDSIDYDFLPQLRDAAEKAEAFFGDMCDLEFTVENGKLYVLSCRPGKRTGRAATMVAIDLFVEGLITGKVMLSRITPSDLYEMFDVSLLLTSESRLITRGIPVSTGIAVGLLKLAPNSGADTSAAVAPFILALREAAPEHIRTLDEATGVLTTTGGPTSHAAVACRGWGKPCVVGCKAKIDLRKRVLRTNGESVSEGEYITINGFTGEVYKGKGRMKYAELMTDPRLLVLIRTIDVLSSERELPVGRVGAIWQMRDMLVHRVPLRQEPELLDPVPAWPEPSSVQDDYVSFQKLKDEEHSLITSEMTDWLIPRDGIDDATYIWTGLRGSLFRLLTGYVGVGRHQKFYRPLVDPLQLIYEPEDFGLSLSKEEKIQIVGEEFFGINYSVPEFVEIEAIRIYAAVVCTGPRELWHVDRTNPHGEKLISGSRKLVALKLVVNDAPVYSSDLPDLYNYLRRKEYFWGWYKHHGIARREIIEFLKDFERSKDHNDRVAEICRQAGLLSRDARVTKVGRSLITQPDLAARRNDNARITGE